MNFELVKSKSLILSNVIAIYTNEERKVSYIEVGIRNDNKFTFLPLEESELKSILFDNHIIETIVLYPKNVLYYSKAANIAILYFQKQRRTINYLGKWVNIPLPGFVFIINNKKLNLFTFKKVGIPDLNTMLYKSPLPNGSSNFCVGNVRTEHTIPHHEEVVRYAEGIIFDGKFTNEYTHNILKSYNEKTYFRFIKKLSKMKDFPTSELIQFKKLGETINEIVTHV